MYKPQIAIIGSRELSPASLSLLKELAYELVSKGYRTVTGGLGSLQQTVHEGAKTNPLHTDCDTIVLLPGFDPKPAINHADVIIPTGLDAYRNVLVANSEVVVAIGGGAGTLSEIAFAWQFKRPIIAIGNEGWADRLAGESLDSRHECLIVDCTSSSIEEIVTQIAFQIETNRPRHQGIS